MRRSWIVMAIMACVCFGAYGASAASAKDASAGAAPTVTPLSDETCSSGNVCYWIERNYQEFKSNAPCTGGIHPLGVTGRSAKNKCANKASFLRRNGERVGCLNALESDPSTLEFNEIFIGVEGSTC
jgi:hypothetical protein